MMGGYYSTFAGFAPPGSRACLIFSPIRLAFPAIPAGAGNYPLQYQGKSIYNKDTVKKRAEGKGSSMEGLKKLLKNMDWIMLGMIILILGINLIILKSASANVYPDRPLYLVQRQLIWIAVGFVFMVLVAAVDYHLYQKLYHVLYGVLIVLLVAVLYTPESKGAHRWFDLGFMDFQPSELGKLIMIICFSCFLLSRGEGLNLKRNWLLAAAYMGLPFGLILRQPDLGTAMVYIFIAFAMAWAAGISPKLIISVLVVGLILLIILFGYFYLITDGYHQLPEAGDIPSWIPLKPYQITRLIIFLNPYMDPLDAGYHMIQSEVAIGSGGLWGKGYGQGSQVQGNFLPEHHTDFIFSVVGEELGFIGAVALLLLYLLMLLRGLQIAYRAKDKLGTTMVVGIISMYAFQIYINAGMAVGVMPITGLPLPFLSYGGSGMLVNMMCLGLVFSVAMRSRTSIF